MDQHCLVAAPGRFQWVCILPCCRAAGYAALRSALASELRSVRSNYIPYNLAGK
ncbi:MAG: hypothetical protein AVDCRST_MAG56-7619 [uncultured Cytophagales bacterium]|uniref:Uncharacterized protein n=1 Tax=uncultured Cytophagales bacterium TaxID=158755 RepID=A0A6J4LME4_9SPHI|nr:MAG: hypothetical protein AVDCRST_MAG56-7619 [uncultured Cytophagales bacterium]